MLCACLAAFAAATVTKSVQSVPTYPFSDPTPVAQLAPQQHRPSYPYFRFDGYSAVSRPQDWEVVTLENDYISISVLPQMGGKIWGAVEKKSGREFIYQNHVMKFRDIAMRGAWTSGGIEFNFGILGHVPTTATPVDYTTRTNEDGSVSCFVASYDWITGAWWMVEINLPEDKAFFTTSVTWYNASGNLQSCYQWMNAAYSIRGNAEFFYPGNASISHSGDWDTYPVTKAGRDIAWYKNTGFGGSLSVHVLGKYSNFYGIYWHDWDFGSAHMAEHADKLGMKYFIWSQARSGAIWEELLTDHDGQYIEQQSGRMFCQPDEKCAATPFQHTALMPAQTDTWTEYWFPVGGIGGIKQTSQLGSLNVVRENGMLRLLFSPLQKLENVPVRVYDGDRLVAEKRISAGVMDIWETAVPAEGALAQEGTLRVDIGDGELVFSDVPADNTTDRPLERPSNFDESTAYAAFIRGLNWANQKRYPEAEKELLASLDKEPCFLPSLTCLARVYNGQGRYDEALALTCKGLAVNTYDGECNYQYAVASDALGNAVHAKDGFAMAAVRDLALRSAAYQHLAEIYIREGSLDKAEKYTRASLAANERNLSSQTLLVTVLRLRNKHTEAVQVLDKALAAAPLFHPFRFEQHMLGQCTAEEFRRSVQAELQDEVFLQLAENYGRMGLYDEAIRLLDMATSPIALYHKAYILSRRQDAQAAADVLRQAQNADPAYVFPHRLSTLRALQWAETVAPAWQNRYYAGLVLLGTQQLDKAAAMLATCDDSGFAPLFLTRASLQSGEDRLAGILRAEKLDPSWRAGRMLLQYYIDNGLYADAVKCGKRYAKRYPDNYYIGVLYANALCKAGQYAESVNVLKRQHVLPYEGATEGHDVWRDAHLGQAGSLLKAGKYKAALQAVQDARLWPENLGVGKPYDDMIDSSREDALEAEIRARMGDK